MKIKTVGEHFDQVWYAESPKYKLTVKIHPPLDFWEGIMPLSLWLKEPEGHSLEQKRALVSFIREALAHIPTIQSPQRHEGGVVRVFKDSRYLDDSNLMFIVKEQDNGTTYTIEVEERSFYV